MTNLAISRAVDPGYGGKRRWVIVGLLSLGMIIAYVSRANLSVVLAIPSFIKSFNLSDTDRGMLNSAFFWAYAVLQIPAGWVVDRYGVKFPYAISFVFWCMASAGTAFAHSVTQLVTLRVLLGVAESIVAPASIRWIRCHFIETERGLAVGLYMTGTKIGPAIAVPLAAWLTMLYGWRPMFLLLGLGGAVWLIPWLLLVRNDDPQIARQVTKEAGKAPVPFGRIMLSPVTWGTIIATFCYMYFVYFCMTWMPAYFVEQRHLSLSKMGFYTFFSFGGMAIMAALAGWAADCDDWPRRQPGYGEEVVHHRRLCHCLHRIDRRAILFRHHGPGFRGSLTLGFGLGNRQLLGAHPNPGPGHGHRAR